MARLAAILSGAVGLAALLTTPAAAADDGENCRYSSQVKKEEIVAVCTRAMKLPKYRNNLEWVSGFHKTRADALADTNQHDAALKDFAEAIRLGRRVSATSEEARDAYYYRAQLYIKLKQFDLAIADLNEAMKIRPTPSTAYSRAESHYGKGDHDRAIAGYDETLKLDPKYKLAFKYRAQSHEHKGDLTRALADARQALELEKASGYSGYSEADIIKRLEGKIAGGGGRPTATVAAPAPPAKPVAPPPAIVPEPPAAIAALPVAPVAPPPAIAASQFKHPVALVFGIGKYSNANPLPNPPHDAADIAAALRRLGFDVVEGIDLNKRGMEDKLREFGRKLETADLALFFYAGHGMQVAGKNYLIPVDAKLERAGDLNLDAIDVSFVLTQMEAERRVNLVFLDACRDNPLSRSFSRSLGTRSSAVGQGLAALQSAAGTMIAFATRPDDVALDGEGRNSPFTAALLKHLPTKGLEISSLMKRVRADVYATTRGKQTPWDHSSLFGDVVLAR